ncbi:TRAP transporter small permease [Rhizobium leguminosarum]|uniref:TRAP transporter small permease n=1 Tax=Rhizobium TaxID=379 RepID=UPI001C9248F9|nr:MULTISPECIES: TRAP transporter small permease [Rhizobium]MBY3173826.1 TRAP transporter small permease [Rhizobium leguminosarum]MBY3446727.1 TRAP transporter small permease [Rhizobium laguerreae]MBY5410932.1 TRAP transporter small permease [Rhizobium leguminosarum]MBY5517883.1 TRAP transporter small permease [Rhizobium leguminosarum]MBY5540745.1 TRAP transporter small permease [Rhizobium leguminosarum]
MSQEIHTQITAEEIGHEFEGHAPTANVSDYAIEDWITLIVFWLMAGCVFLQFFTRYVLNDSYAWTEEIAINCLIGVVFLGSVMCVRTSRHIQVDVFYHYMPAGLARVLATFVDIVRIGFFAYGCHLMWRYVDIVAEEQMVTIDLPRNIVFYTVLVAFVLMLIRAVIVFIANMRRGYSVLERPEEFQTIEG